MTVNDLPNKWKIECLENVAKWGSGGTPTSTNPSFYNGNIPWLVIGDLNDGYISKSEKTITKLGLDNSSAKIVKPDSVLVAMYGSIGKLGINKIPLATNQAIAFTEEIFQTIYNKYLFHYLFHIREKLHSLGKGGTQKNISQTVLKKVQIPLPPLPEQHRIVAKIEELFSELDKGIETLKTAKQQLKVYRQAVLKYAFQGDFTKEKRENGEYPDLSILLTELNNFRVISNNTLKFSEIVEDENYPKKPNEWVWMRNEALLKYVTSGSRDWKKYYSSHGSIFIRTQDIKTNSLELIDAAYVKLPEKVEGKRSLVEPGDILMTITGANVGKVAIIPENIPEAYVSQSVALMKLLDKRLSKYLWYYFQSRTYGEGLISGLVYGVGRPVLSLENMREVAVAICSIEEQNDIIQEIESRLSVCEKIEESIEQGLQQAEALRQSILKKAFEGKLVPQDPNDEPASILLERIKAERNNAQPEKKTRTKKVKA